MAASKLDKRVDAVIDAATGRSIVGCVVLVNVHGQTVYARAAGLADRDAGKPVQRDTIFRLASVTKPIVATAALRMMDAGLLKLDDAVQRYLPWFAHDVTIRQLMTHTSGLTYAMPSDVSTGLSGPIISLEENLRRVGRLPLAFTPGQGWAYGMGIDVLGGVLAAIEQATLADVVANYVTKPLGLCDTQFHVTDDARLAVPYADGAPPVLMGEPHPVPDGEATIWFSPARIFNRDAPQSGGAGMAGTADDVMAVMECYQPGATFLREATRLEALANQTVGIARRPQDAGKGFCLIGAIVDDREVAATPCSVGAVDWGGVWGNKWIVDPAQGVSLVICSNTALEGCRGPFTIDIRDAVFGATDLPSFSKRLE